jgi:transcriptional regulator with XRE-family HTH domain
MASAEKASFGQLLRRYRVAAGLTQEELAAQSGLGVRTISDLERGVSRRAHPSTLAQLAEALKIPPGELNTLEAAWHAARSASPEEAPPHSVPTPLTSFIGRVHEVADLMSLLAEARLITLTGSGGCGKTRLALEVAKTARDRFPGGIWVVELAPLADPAAVAGTVAATLGMREQSGGPTLPALVRHVGTERMLLVLDNCEHLIATCAQFAESLAQACPHLSILATSREALDIGGEHVFRVPSLSVPAPQNDASAEHVAAS